jgi:copper homeostasis protein
VILLEVCVETTAAAQQAQQLGAGRLELCARLDLDGLTPDVSILAEVIAAVDLPVHAMVRPRDGDFSYDRADLDACLRDIETLAAAGAHGLVLGVLDQRHRIDIPATAELVHRARPLPITFHRAFDRVPDPVAAYGVLADLGIEVVLTSGGAARAWEGRSTLRRLVELSNEIPNGPVVMAGGGVRADHAEQLVKHTGVHELHGSVPFEIDMGFLRRS